MKSTRSRIFSVLFALALSLAPAFAAPPAVLHGMDEAISQARSQNKVAFIMLGRKTCSYCNHLRKMIREGEVPVTSEQFVMADIDADNPEVVRAFKKRFPKETWGNSLPFVVMAGPHGEVLTSYSGPRKQPKLTSIIQAAVAQKK